jgi:hypothetical protein
MVKLYIYGYLAEAVLRPGDTTIVLSVTDKKLIPTARIREPTPNVGSIFESDADLPGGAYPRARQSCRNANQKSDSAAVGVTLRSPKTFMGTSKNSDLREFVRV